jgi:hypothetical protein
MGRKGKKCGETGKKWERGIKTNNEFQQQKSSYNYKHLTLLVICSYDFLDLSILSKKAYIGMPLSYCVMSTCCLQHNRYLSNLLGLYHQLFPIILSINFTIFCMGD